MWRAADRRLANRRLQPLGHLAGRRSAANPTNGRNPSPLYRKFSIIIKSSPQLTILE